MYGMCTSCQYGKYDMAFLACNNNMYVYQSLPSSLSTRRASIVCSNYPDKITCYDGACSDDEHDDDPQQQQWHLTTMQVAAFGVTAVDKLLLLSLCCLTPAAAVVVAAASAPLA